MPWSFSIAPMHQRNFCISWQSKDPFHNILHLFSLTGDVVKALLDTAVATILNNDQEALKSLTKLVDQLPSVFGEVFLQQGILDLVLKIEIMLLPF